MHGNNFAINSISAETPRFPPPFRGVQQRWPTAADEAGQEGGQVKMGLDRFEYGFSDPQSEEAIVICAGCGGGIHRNEDVYVFDGKIFHDDWACLVQYIDPKIMTVEEALRI